MSILNTFLNKISKKESVKDNKVFPQEDDNISEQETDDGTDDDAPAQEGQSRVFHIPKLIKYMRAKQYFKGLDKTQSTMKKAGYFNRDRGFGLSPQTGKEPTQVTLNTKNKIKKSLLWPLFNDTVKDDKVSTFLWSWIERPFLSLLLPKKNVWWVMSENNEYFPAITDAPFGNQNIVRSYLIHIMIWLPIFYIYYNHSICGKATQKPIIIGFFFGLLSFLLVDILNNNNTDLLVDRNNMEWNISSSANQSDDITVIKKTDRQFDNILGNMDKTHGLMYKPKEFSQFAMKQNLHLLPLKDWYTNHWRKSIGDVGKTDEAKHKALARAYTSISSAGYYLISNIVTIGIVTARANLKYFRFITPLILLISIITICGIYNWIWSYHAEQSYINLNYKRKILIEAISISITCCLLVINCKFFKHHDYLYDKIFL